LIVGARRVLLKLQQTCVRAVEISAAGRQLLRLRTTARPGTQRFSATPHAAGTKDALAICNALSSDFVS
jgi:hypothetical protein